MLSRLWRVSVRGFVSGEFKEIIAPEKKWKQRWDQVQEKIKDQQEIAQGVGVYHPGINWFPGHMYKASREMEEILSTSDVSLVLEIRDARIPFSSSNPMIDNLLRDHKKKRIIVLNKSDLSNPSLHQRIEEHLLSQENILDVMHTNSREQKTIENLLDRSIELVKQIPNIQTYKIFVVGMPNVGKSSIINVFKRISGSVRIRHPNEEQQNFLDDYKERYGSLPFTLMDTSVESSTRKKRGAKKKNAYGICKTGAKAGVTRTIEQFIISKQNPRIMCLDSPGIMVPKLYSSNQALRLAVVGSLRDELVGEELIGEYLLWNLNQNGKTLYRKKYSLGASNEVLNSYETVLNGIARSIGGTSHQGALNRNRAAKKFLFDYRRGKLGTITLDELKNKEIISSPTDTPSSSP